MENINEKPVILFGIGVVSECVVAYFSDQPRYKITGVVVDNKFKRSEQFMGLPLYAYQDLHENYRPDEVNIVVCIGYSNLNKDRLKVSERLLSDGWQLGSLIHGANYLRNFTFAQNTILMPNVNIQPHVDVGEGNIFWPGSMIGHHSKVGAYNWFTSNSLIGGNTQIGSFNFFGMGATILNNVRVDDENIVNANCTIDKRTDLGDVYFYNQAAKHRMKSLSFAKMTNFGQ